MASAYFSLWSCNSRQAYSGLCNGAYSQESILRIVLWDGFHSQHSNTTPTFMLLRSTMFENVLVPLMKSKSGGRNPQNHFLWTCSECTWGYELHFHSLLVKYRMIYNTLSVGILLLQSPDSIWKWSKISLAEFLLGEIHLFHFPTPTQPAELGKENTFGNTCLHISVNRNSVFDSTTGLGLSQTSYADVGCRKSTSLIKSYNSMHWLLQPLFPARLVAIWVFSQCSDLPLGNEELYLITEKTHPLVSSL